MSTKIKLREEKRREVVQAIVIRQEPVHLVSRVFNVPQRTVFDWLSLYRAGGWDALREGARSGRPRKLSAEDMQWVYDAVTMGNPLNHQFDFCLWTLNILRTMIERKRGVRLSKSAISRLLGHLGLSAQRPVYKSYKQDPKKMKEYLSHTFPEAVAQAKAVGARLFFVDEASVRSDSHRGTTWGKIGETPVVQDSGGRFSMNVISAVSPRGDLRFHCFDGRMDSKGFIQFLRKLHRDAGKPIIVVVDNARYHHSKETQRFIDDHKGEISLVFLPPYSPEFNPDEQVWNHAKARLSKRPIMSKQDLKSHLNSILHSIQKSVSLVKSFFKLSDTKYIVEAFS